jgi:hypothetical protein
VIVVAWAIAVGGTFKQFLGQEFLFLFVLIHIFSYEDPNSMLVQELPYYIAARRIQLVGNKWNRVRHEME